jgi:hypothetical protein
MTLLGARLLAMAIDAIEALRAPAHRRLGTQFAR